MIENKPNLFSPRNLAKAKTHARKMLLRIKLAHSGGKEKRFRRLIIQYLRSMDAWVVAVLQAYVALCPFRRPNKKQLASIAEAINPWQTSDEPVVLSIKPKPNGGQSAGHCMQERRKWVGGVNSMVRGSQC
jgi:hypothetical protein